MSATILLFPQVSKRSQTATALNVDRQDVLAYSERETHLMLTFANTGIQRIRRLCRRAENEPVRTREDMRMAHEQIGDCIAALAELERRIRIAGATASEILRKPKKSVKRRKGGMK